MNEPEPGRVQGHPVERVAAAAELPVADYGMAERGELGADLAAPPGHQRELEEGRVPATLEDVVAGDRVASGTPIPRGPDAERAVLHDPPHQRALIALNDSLHERDVNPLDASRGELRLEALLGGRGLREDDDPRRLPVEPVNDQEPTRPAGGRT